LKGVLILEQFTYVKRGYDPEEVDRYIATLEQVIKSYKEKDNAIKNAIISAQIAADNMVKNAKNQADEYKGQIAKELDKVTQEIDRQRMRIQAFQDVYSGLVRTYLTDLDGKDMEDLFSRLEDVDKLVNKLKEVDITPPSADRPLVPQKKEEPIPPGNPFAPMSSSPPPAPPMPPLSLGPSSSPSLNKNPAPPSGYSPPQVVAKINDEGNYVPNS
jgi:cell division septum initiation protein DivIVA